jgi:hypothetical protein
LVSYIFKQIVKNQRNNRRDEAGVSVAVQKGILIYVYDEKSNHISNHLGS